MIDRVKVIQPKGNLDASKSPEFRDEISSLLESDAKIFLVDFKDVSFMDSSGLGALVLAFKTVRAYEKKLVVCSINEQVRILFELTGMDKVFEVFNNREEFDKSLLSRA
ncbi:MAG: STAS domain-containing protein [Mastigocoleus sp. MO_167.B18]|uniref:STAS domain-containing protein n=1 Tax=Mastigocoleus sp. MO_188.B34 TaxID=3036635 RepID=UPI0026156F08|nr:STAS domain-containing protein [Mastigocoleus sp. MO_188.B34]MDJ0697826.1 STAS domain-containing protein [Mastigocoleus sp. MO_188.B34]MDJ0772711.1 STAS domain-containing protein [Mastigocoleus sp. MO_167.B18]